MSEDNDAPDSGAGADPVAMAIAMRRATKSLDDDLAAYLRDQRHHLHEQLKRLKIGVISDRLSITLKVLTALVGVGVAAFFALMLWDAAHSSGLVVEPFAVPSGMAANGLTGQVVASQMLDKLTAMQAATYSSRPPQPYENNWGNNLKVEIPETGVSVGELQQFLKDWLGHDTHITGEVYRTATGIAVTARDGSEAGATFTGPESDFDKLLQQAAEHVYGDTQPFRYANYLDRDLGAPDIQERAARAAAIYRKLIAGPNVQEQAWGWYGLGFISGFITPLPGGSGYYHGKAVAADPDFTLSQYNLANNASGAGQYEEALPLAAKTKALLARRNVPDVVPAQIKLRALFMDARISAARGDYGQELRDWKQAIQAPEFFENAALGRDNVASSLLIALAHLHDGGGVRDTMRQLGISVLHYRFSNAPGAPATIGAAFYVFGALEDWPDILRIEKELDAPVLRRYYQTSPKHTAYGALAHVHMGDISGAEALVAPAPADCDDCTIARARIADMQGQSARADYWFQMVEKAEPSVPFGDATWGQALLERGQSDAAIARFKLANQKGPHFADPLEGWGEALMAKNQSHLALAKFTEAEKYAPNWGRLHLKWGEALYYAGNKTDAAKQFSQAATLDLTAAEKSELAGMNHG